MAELHLVFSLRGVRYALDADQVREIVWLPELSAIADAAPWVIGAFNLRGHVVPVLDLSLCFGHGRTPLHSGDAVVVSEVAGERCGLLVREVLDAVPISPADIEDVRGQHNLLTHTGRFLRGVAMLGHELAMVLDAPALLEAAGLTNDTIREPDTAGEALECRETELLHERARGMALTARESDDAGGGAFALFRIDAELFGVPVRFVQTFMRLGAVWPVPCCPPHILGSMNVRGDVLALVDLRPVFGLPVGEPPAEVAVLKAGTTTFGLAVGTVLDVTSAKGEAPFPVESIRRDWPFCRGTAQSNSRVFSVIDIEALLAARVLHVGEKVGHKSSGPETVGSDCEGV